MMAMSCKSDLILPHVGLWQNDLF